MKRKNQAESNISNLSKDVLNIDGLTGLKIKHFLNNLSNYENVNYLEVGINNGKLNITNQ
jgi:hypothetical protein